MDRYYNFSNHSQKRIILIHGEESFFMPITGLSELHFNYFIRSIYYQCHVYADVLSLESAGVSFVFSVTAAPKGLLNAEQCNGGFSRHKLYDKIRSFRGDQRLIGVGNSQIRTPISIESE